MRFKVYEESFFIFDNIIYKRYKKTYALTRLRATPAKAMTGYCRPSFVQHLRILMQLIGHRYRSGQCMTHSSVEYIMSKDCLYQRF